MKRLIFLFIFFVTTNVAYNQSFNSVTVDSTNGNIVFSEVIIIDSTNKNELYSRAREWFALTFNSADAVLQMDDRESGKLIGKALQYIFIPTALSTVKVKMYYTISIYVKENRYKYLISNITYKMLPSEYVPNPSEVRAEEVITDHEVNQVKPKVRDKYRTETLRVINGLSESIKHAMTLKGSEINDKW